MSRRGGVFFQQLPSEERERYLTRTFAELIKGLDGLSRERKLKLILEYLDPQTRQFNG